MRWRHYGLLVKILVFTILAPGSVTVWIPFLFLTRHPDFKRGPLTVFAVCLMALGASLYFWCAWEFASKGKGTPAPIDPPSALVAGTLYRIVRNPMYVGVELVLLGEAMLLRSARLLAYACFVWLVFHGFVVLYEEPTQKKNFGSAFEQYCRAVPRWIPRFSGLRSKTR